VATTDPRSIDDSERSVTGPRALTRLLALFDALSASADGLSLADLSIVLDSPKSSLLNLLRPMVAEA
jgi:IclR family acetate operon transcriptional repressor